MGHKNKTSMSNIDVNIEGMTSMPTDIYYIV